MDRHTERLATMSGSLGGQTVTTLAVAQPGNYGAFLFLADTVFTAFTSPNSTVSLTATYPKGSTLFVKCTTFTLTSGAVHAYNENPNAGR